MTPRRRQIKYERWLRRKCKWWVWAQDGEVKGAIVVRVKQ